MVGGRNSRFFISKRGVIFGFRNGIDLEPGDKVELLEKLALSWNNQAIMQGHGRSIAFRLVRR